VEILRTKVMSIVGEGQGEGEISSVILRYEVPKNLVLCRCEDAEKGKSKINGLNPSGAGIRGN
jgi:hypothetical protein